MRAVNGLKVAFVNSESYFQGLNTPSMASTAEEIGADVVFLLAEGETEADVSDKELEMLAALLLTRSAAEEQ